MSLTDGEKNRVSSLLEMGLGLSTVRLAKMSRSEWLVETISIKEVSPVSLLSWFSRGKEENLAVSFDSQDPLPLDCVVLFPLSSARSLSSAITSSHGEGVRALGEEIGSVIGEVANILAHSALGALADAGALPLILSSPRVHAGEKARLLNDALARYDGTGKSLLLSHIEMQSKDLVTKCNMVIVLDVPALRKILAKG